MTHAIAGLWVATVTPLDADGNVDAAALAAHCAWLDTQGCDGYVLFGTTGEGPSFTADERLAALDGVLRAGVKADRLALGTGAAALPDTIALTRGALARGVVRTLQLAPFFWRDAGEDGIHAAFARTIDAAGDDRLRMFAYNIPQVARPGVPPAVLARLRRDYGAVAAGVKDSSAVFENFRAYRAASPDSTVLVGAETDIARALAEGGAGTICGMANIVPAAVRAMFDQDATAEAAMRAACTGLPDPFLPALKAAIAAATGREAWLRVRAPLTPLTLAAGGPILEAVRGGGARRAA